VDAHYKLVEKPQPLHHDAAVGELSEEECRAIVRVVA
jgi:hypothetical protein